MNPPMHLQIIHKIECFAAHVTLERPLVFMQHLVPHPAAKIHELFRAHLTLVNRIFIMVHAFMLHQVLRTRVHHITRVAFVRLVFAQPLDFRNSLNCLDCCICRNFRRLFLRLQTSRMELFVPRVFPQIREIQAARVTFISNGIWLFILAKTCKK